MWNTKEDAAGGQPTLTNMANYRDAVDEFTRNATELIEHIPLFTKAREAYEEALRVSQDLRDVLDTGDQTLHALMVQLEQAADLHLPGADKRKPEPMRIETIHPEARNILAANG